MNSKLAAVLARHERVVGDVHATPLPVSFSRGPWDNYRPAYVAFDPFVNDPQGLGSWALGGSGDVLAQANGMISGLLPPPVLVAIDAAPLTLMEKQRLKKEPLSVFILLAEKAQGALIEYIERVGLGAMPRAVAKWGTARSTTARSPYSITVGGVVVRIDPKRTDTPIRLAMQFLAVSFKNIVKAHQVVVQMIYEAGVRAPIDVATAVVGSQIKSATDAVNKAAADMNKALQNVFQMPKLFGALGDGGTASGTTATGATAAGGSIFKTLADLAGFVEVAIATAAMLMKPLDSLDKGNTPQKPSANDIAASAAASSQAKISNLPSDIKDAAKGGMNWTPWAIGGGVVGVGVLAWLLTRKGR
jgi:hypothetical protein